MNAERRTFYILRSALKRKDLRTEVPSDCEWPSLSCVSPARPRDWRRTTRTMNAHETVRNALREALTLLAVHFPLEQSFRAGHFPADCQAVRCERHRCGQ